MILTLSGRDHELLLALAQRVRLFTLRQVALHWWAGEAPNARRRLKQLVQAGLIERIEVNARTLPELTQPLIVWRPAMDQLDFNAVSYQLQRRWQSLPVRSCTAFIATSRTAAVYGGKNRGELKRPLQATHDLGVSEVWLQLRRTAVHWANAWCGEDLLAHTRRGEKCPDAFIVNDDRQVLCVIEFGGQYQAERLREFHLDCAERGLPYQVW
jgi:hypothetical protein